MRAAVEGSACRSSIFAKLGHNEHPATHRRVAAVLDDLRRRVSLRTP